MARAAIFLCIERLQTSPECNATLNPGIGYWVPSMDSGLSSSVFTPSSNPPTYRPFWLLGSRHILHSSPFRGGPPLARVASLYRPKSLLLFPSTQLEGLWVALAYSSHPRLICGRPGMCLIVLCNIPLSLQDTSEGISPPADFPLIGRL